MLLINNGCPFNESKLTEEIVTSESFLCFENFDCELPLDTKNERKKESQGAYWNDNLRN